MAQDVTPGRSRWSAGLRYRALVRYLIPLVVALAVCAIAMHQVRQISVSNPANFETFYSLAEGLEPYKEFKQEWRPRILANAAASALVLFAEARLGLTDPRETMPYVASLWVLGWLSATFALFIALTRERALLYIFGTFTAILFAYTPGIGFPRLAPYELPAMFTFACFVGLLMLRRLEWLAVLIPIAVLFKETALVLLVAYFFWPGATWRRRLIYAAATAAIAFGVKAAVDIVTENPSPVLTMTADYSPTLGKWEDNVRRLLDLRDWTNHPMFVNAGLLLALLVLPAVDREIVVMKVMAAIFVIGNFVFGLIDEHAIWFELIPLALYGIDRYFFGSPLAVSWLTRRLARPPPATL